MLLSPLNERGIFIEKEVLFGMRLGLVSRKFGINRNGLFTAIIVGTNCTDI